MVGRTKTLSFSEGDLDFLCSPSAVYMQNIADVLVLLVRVGAESLE
jgi:phage host-nuclease inhibitor protein Gam